MSRAGKGSEETVGDDRPEAPPFLVYSQPIRHRNFCLNIHKSGDLQLLGTGTREGATMVMLTLPATHWIAGLLIVAEKIVKLQSQPPQQLELTILISKAQKQYSIASTQDPIPERL